MWQKLHGRRQGSGFGPLPLSTAEVMARLELEGVPRCEWPMLDEWVQVVEEEWWRAEPWKRGKDD